MYGTSRDIQRALTTEPVIDDSAAREWMQGGVRLDAPPPTFARDDFRWTLRQADGADGTVLKHDPETGQWVPVDDN